MDAETVAMNSSLSPEVMVRLVGRLTGIGGLPADNSPHVPSPIDPIIRFALRDVLGPVGIDRQSAIERGLRHQYVYSDLNPQPLPPRAAFVVALARAALIRAELIGEAAAVSGQTGVAGRYILDVVDDWCPTPPRPFPWPWPGKRPTWAEEAVGPADHLLFAGVIDATLSTSVGGEFAEALTESRARLVDTALAQMG